MILADKAFANLPHIGKSKKAAFLRSIADEIIAIGDTLIERASAESGLPPDACRANADAPPIN